MPNHPNEGNGNNPIKPSATSSTSLQFDRIFKKSPIVEIDTRQFDEKLYSFENVEFQIFNELYSDNQKTKWDWESDWKEKNIKSDKELEKLKATAEIRLEAIMKQFQL